MTFKFAHFNFNITDLARSLKFYEEALGLKEKRRLQAEDGSYTIVYLSDGSDSFELELTCLPSHPQKYDLGECEFHLAMVTEDFAAAKAKHEALGCICYVNEEMGIYFIEDPDGYWIEIIPPRLSGR